MFYESLACHFSYIKLLGACFLFHPIGQRLTKVFLDFCYTHGARCLAWLHPKRSCEESYKLCPGNFHIAFSPPVRWGLLDFMYAVLPLLLPLLPLLLPRRPLRQMSPDAKRDLQSAVGNAGVGGSLLPPMNGSLLPPMKGSLLLPNEVRW